MTQHNSSHDVSQRHRVHLVGTPTALQLPHLALFLCRFRCVTFRLLSHCEFCELVTSQVKEKKKRKPINKTRKSHFSGNISLLFNFNSETAVSHSRLWKLKPCITFKRKGMTKQMNDHLCWSHIQSLVAFPRRLRQCCAAVCK